MIKSNYNTIIWVTPEESKHFGNNLEYPNGYFKYFYNTNYTHSTIKANTEEELKIKLEEFKKKSIIWDNRMVDLVKKQNGNNPAV